MYELFTKDFIKDNINIKSDITYYILYILLSIPFLLIKIISNIPIISDLLLASICDISGYSGFFFRSIYYREKLEHMGKNVLFDIGILIKNPENIKIGDNSYIDTYVKLEGNEGYIHIGKYVHICSYVLLQGLGGLTIEDFSGVAAGSKIYTATNHYGAKDENTKSLSSVAPRHMQNIIKSKVSIGECAFIGLNSIVLPGSNIGKYAIVGAGSLVKNQIDPYTIVAGVPAKLLKIRDDIKN